MKHKDNGEKMFYRALQYTAKINGIQVFPSREGTYALSLAIMNSIGSADAGSNIKNKLVELYVQDYKKNERASLTENLEKSFSLDNSNPWINAPSKRLIKSENYKVDREKATMYEAIKQLGYLPTA
jgi:hypothetical protein